VSRVLAVGIDDWLWDGNVEGQTDRCRRRLHDIAGLICSVCVTSAVPIIIIYLIQYTTILS
jgi:hypothetical protein